MKQDYIVDTSGLKQEPGELLLDEIKIIAVVREQSKEEYWVSSSKLLGIIDRLTGTHWEMRRSNSASAAPECSTEMGCGARQ